MVALLGSMTKSHLKKVSDERLPTRSTPAHFPKTPYLHPPPSRSSAASASPIAGTNTRQTPYYERHNSWTRTDPFATPYLAAEPAPIPTNKPLSETSSPVPIPTSHRVGPPSSSTGTGGRGHDRQRTADGKPRHTPASGHAAASSSASPTGSAPAVQASIYDQYKTARHPFANPPLFVGASPTVKYTSEGVVDIDALDDEASHFRAAADPTAPHPLPHSHSKTPADDQSASAQQRDRKLSRASSFEFTVWSPSSTTTDLPSIVEMDADTAARSRTSTMTHRPSPLGPGSAPAGSKGADAQESGYDTAASATKSASRRGPPGNRAGRIGATDVVSESGEHDEEKDQLHQLRDYRNSKLHSLTNLDARFNQSALSVGSRVKADKILGLEPNVTLASLYLVSGLGREPEQWSLSDADATRGVQTLDDSMGIFWRPEVLGNAFAGDTIDSFTDLVKDPKGNVRNGTKPNPSLKNRVVPDAGPAGARKLISKTVKFAHPRDLEVVNSTLAPPSTCHAFSFTLPRVDTLAAIARTRLDSALPDRPLSELDTTFVWLFPFCMLSRDVTLLIEDPGPYIIGITSECQYVVITPPEVVMVDLDTNSLICKTPPANVVTPKHKRDKSRAKIMQALGPAYPSERSIPMEYKVSYPTGSFKNFNKIYDTATRDRPRYLGERFRMPSWWKHAEVMSTFDKIMVDKHKKPTLIQRLTRSGISRPEAQLSVGEQLAKRMMRKRALHYVETRDDLELKVARINRRLLKLTQEGEHWKQQFETFEKYADRLAHEANDLKLKIERERREAKRLSTLANEQTKAKDELEDRLQKTEDARAEAMRQLSEMHISIQELEREREEIMDVFEMQINTALQVMPPGSPTPSSRPSTPGTSALSVASPRPQLKGLRQRPATKDSALSQLSRLTDGTVRSRSIMDALDRASGRQGSSIVDRDALPPADRAIFDRTDAIASRIVSIQQKLQLALDSVTTGQTGSLERSTSIASRISTSAGDGEDQVVETPSGTASTIPANGLGLEGEDINPPSHSEAMSTPRGPTAVQGLQVEEADPDSVSISSEALTEKGRARSQYNTTPPTEMPSVDRLKDFKLKPSRSPVRTVRVVAVQPAKTAKDEFVSEQESENGTMIPSMLMRRSATDGSLSVEDEVLVSPSPSKEAFDMGHHEGADPAGQFEDAEREGPKKGNDGTSKRFSGMSTATVAFG